MYLSVLGANRQGRKSEVLSYIPINFKSPLWPVVELMAKTNQAN